MSCRHARVKRSRADRRQKRHPVLRAVGRTMAVLGVTLLGILATAYGAVALMCKGPSPTARDMFVTTMMETSAAKFVPRLFLSGAEIEAILAKFRNEEMSVDALAAEVRRATTLIAFCRKRLLKAESDVKKITGE